MTRVAPGYGSEGSILTNMARAAMTGGVLPVSSGKWSGPGHTFQGVVLAALNVEYATPIMFSSNITVSKIAVQVNGAVTNAALRFGIRSNEPSLSYLYPHLTAAPLFDYGSALACATTGVKTFDSVNTTLTAWTPYWFTFTAQTAIPNMFIVMNTIPMLAEDIPTLATGNARAYSQTGVTGALPSGFGAMLAATTVPRFWVLAT